MKKIIDDIKAELQKMSASRDETYIKTYVQWEGNRGFSVECIRDNKDSNIYDPNGNVMDDRAGVPIQFQVYYQVNHYDEDMCKLTSALSVQDMADLKEFVDMYE